MNTFLSSSFSWSVELLARPISIQREEEEQQQRGNQTEASSMRNLLRLTQTEAHTHFRILLSSSLESVCARPASSNEKRVRARERERELTIKLSASSLKSLVLSSDLKASDARSQCRSHPARLLDRLGVSSSRLNQSIKCTHLVRNSSS